MHSIIGKIKMNVKLSQITQQIKRAVSELKY